MSNTTTNTTTNNDKIINPNHNSNYQARIGVQGIHLKKFEEVVCDCISDPQVIPKYVPLPDAPTPERLQLIKEAIKQSNRQADGTQKGSGEDDKNENGEDIPQPSFPFDILPSAACVRIMSNHYYENGTSASYSYYERYTLGKLSGMRAVKKEWQLSSMIRCLLALLPTHVLGPSTAITTTTNNDNPNTSRTGDSLPEKNQEDSTVNKDDIDNDKRETKKTRFKIVDFAGGTGHLALPLAIMLPKCDIILVDLKATSLELVHEKAKDFITPSDTPFLRDDLFLPPGYNDDYTNSTHSTIDNNHNNSDSEKVKKKKKQSRRIKPKRADLSRNMNVTCHENILQQNQHIPNLYTYHGDITNYAQNHDFDIGLSLHCCGEGTDLVLQECGKAKAHFIVSPCCVGKLSSQKRNPYVYHATSGNESRVVYPQSSIFRTLIPDQIKFDALAKAADYNDWNELRTSRNATRRTAKALLETDRMFMCKEVFGYDNVVLTKMKPWEASPKNDILIGWFDNDYNFNGDKSINFPYANCDGSIENLECDEECNADIEMAMRQLLAPTQKEKDGTTCGISGASNTSKSADWNIDEIERYRMTLVDFVASDETALRFPTRMGSRIRKLIHYLAEEMDLRHWSEGKKEAEKIVVVAKKKKK